RWSDSTIEQEVSNISLRLKKLRDPSDCTLLVPFLDLNEKIWCCTPNGVYASAEDSLLVPFDVNLDESDVVEIELVEAPHRNGLAQDRLRFFKKVLCLHRAPRRIRYENAKDCLAALVGKCSSFDAHARIQCSKV